MTPMGLPVERRVLCDGRVFTPEEFARWVHPGAGNVTEFTRFVPVDCDTDHRPVGHDGATSERYPAVPVGHMRGDL